jgi:hypothetical protein
MVGNASGGENRDAVVSSDAGEIFGEFGDQSIRNQVLALFGGEYAVYEDIGIFMRHAASSSRTRMACM